MQPIYEIASKLVRHEPPAAHHEPVAEFAGANHRALAVGVRLPQQGLVVANERQYERACVAWADETLHVLDGVTVESPQKPVVGRR
jgi:hypothetical protein